MASIRDVASARVQGVSRLVAQRLVTVRTSSATLVTTPEHPFAKLGAGWTRAADLTRGDRVEIAGGGHATVVAVEIREVQPTAVYNLTVSKTHAYFVGAQAVLVHNTDCGGPSSSKDSRKRKRVVRPNEERERFDARRAQHNERLEAAWRERERKREQHRMTQNPFNDMPGMPNCTYCSLAGLSDVDKVSTLVQQRNLDLSDPNLTQPGQSLTAEELNTLMLKWGLKSQDALPIQKFPPTSAEQVAGRMQIQEDIRNGKPRPTFPFQDGAKEFMETSSANTFVVATAVFKDGRYSGHALLAVRRDDDSIVYLDLQNVPPTSHDALDPRCNYVSVNPTNVDWRVNRQLSNVVENGVHVPFADMDLLFP